MYFEEFMSWSSFWHFQQFSEVSLYASYYLYKEKKWEPNYIQLQHATLVSTPKYK